MAFNPKHLVSYDVGAHPAVADPATQQGYKTTLYHYSTTDTATVASAAGYFNAAADTLRKGDCILIVASAAGTPELRHQVVTNVTGAGVVSMAGLAV